MPLIENLFYFSLVLFQKPLVNAHARIHDEIGRRKTELSELSPLGQKCIETFFLVA
jgi:hypothetical protein